MTSLTPQGDSDLLNVLNVMFFIIASLGVDDVMKLWVISKLATINNITLRTFSRSHSSCGVDDVM